MKNSSVTKMAFGPADRADTLAAGVSPQEADTSHRSVAEIGGVSAANRSAAMATSGASI
jgi:hypothetical protein